jgi:hypothetical protein
MSPTIRGAVQTNVDAESPITRDDARENEARRKWQDIIDYQLIDWGMNPSQFDDEGDEPPSRETVGVAIRVATEFQKDGRVAPSRVVPDAQGGIVFERKERNLFETIRIQPDGKIEYSVFRNSRLVHREYW